MEMTKENKAMVLFIKYVFIIHLLSYIYIIIIFPVILYYCGSPHESLDETYMSALLGTSILVSLFCVGFVAMEKKTFSEFKRLVDSVYDTKQFYEKQEKMQEEISDLKNSKTTVGNFLVLSQLYNVVKYIMYVLHNQHKGIEYEEIHCNTY